MTLTPRYKGRYIPVENWSLYCAHPVEPFLHLVSDVTHYTTVDRIAFYDSPEEFMARPSAGPADRNRHLKAYLCPHHPSMDAEIEALVKERGLGHLTRNWNDGYEGVTYLHFEKAEVRKGIYYNLVEEMELGRNLALEHRFGSHEYWGGFNALQDAFNCLEARWFTSEKAEDEMIRMRMEFRFKFMDRYQPGLHLLHVLL